MDRFIDSASHLAQYLLIDGQTDKAEKLFALLNAYLEECKNDQDRTVRSTER
jgi:hypothetical protein